MLRILALCVLLSLLPAASTATVIHVPDEIATIESALLSAAPNDTIIVDSGTYFVNLEWPATPGIKLLSEAGPHATVLDGRDDVQVIGIYSGVDTTTVIHGFTIQNGHAEGQ